MFDMNKAEDDTDKTECVQMLLRAHEDLKWYNDHLIVIKSKYQNRFIAFCNKTIVDSDTDFKRLLARMKRKGTYTGNTLFEYISDMKFILNP